MKSKSCFSVFSATLLLVGLAARAATYELVVSAGDVTREQSIVAFALPLKGDAWRLHDSRGSEVPLQVTQREGAFVLARLAAGASATYRLESGRPSRRASSAARVSLERREGKIAARVGERAVLSFQEEKSMPPEPGIDEMYRRGGYIHPVFSPSGAVVTGDYPSDHYHHHGIWFAWVKTEYEGRSPDFWNVQDHLGRVDFQGIERFWSGPVHGGIVARFHSIDILARQPKAVIDETWEVRVYPVGEGARRYGMFDLVSTQQLFGASPLKLLQYRYGGIGIRGHRQWDGTGEKTRFLTSTGERDRIKAHESRALWCHMGGLVDGRFTGLATLAHPENFRSPEPMRVNPKIPLLNFAPSQAGDWEMLPGKTYVWRYRFIVHDGEPDQAWLDSRWRDYAEPVAVTLKPIKS